ncbi:response regulator [[Archangium] primigenium]|uniref:response regulator n=1 Tax=Melittangium TaxID=44 RepID=UPI00195E52AC|nr:response regulator [Archangium primigenium]MBM7112882.1 response regulator [Archangium primigenium]
MSKLLIVDDEVAILEALTDILSVEGYDVTTAANGVEGLKHVAQARPDLILLDLMMPLMDGHEMLRRLKDDPSLRTIPVVVMSAGRVSKSELHGSRFLAKPFELDDLLDTVTAELGKTPA